ncbi:sugar-specific transcriptional regulator TrmB [Actinomadura pelletieri DSM 43383]|uniref:Sugar-specific transcriptional regulator TrmB n=1 Tax=Actinomadura pelletieri DSM 43383 TaxID=1120940 RepID=A0A495QGA6_9ACTN|nr:LuxR family transcriptional regulator [Actinomadura pelletieri]RKS70915.1 sugar-specific transcriptional regulator TrmB [Actinomadura pelletieri DSM 43383]
MSPASATGENPFAALGVTASQQSIYSALLYHPGSTLGELVKLTGEPRARLAALLTELESLGMVGVDACAGPAAGERTDPRYLPYPPDAVVEALIHKRETEFIRARIEAKRLSGDLLAAEQRTNPQKLVEVIDGTDAVAQRYEQVQRRAVKQVKAIDKPPYAVDPVGPNEIERERLASGVEYHVIYTPEALAIPGKRDVVRQDAVLGEQARVLENPPTKLVIVDDEMALMPLQGDEPGMTAVIRPSTLLDILISVFDNCWEQATPLYADKESCDVWPRLSDADRHLLTLLAAGLKDEAVARYTGMGARTVSRHVARLLRTLNARTRFQAGVHAARRGLI